MGSFCQKFDIRNKNVFETIEAVDIFLWIGDWPLPPAFETAKYSSNVKLDLVRSFLRLTDSVRNIFERIERFKANLWRQTAQTICLLYSFRVRKTGPDKSFGRRFRAAKKR